MHSDEDRRPDPDSLLKVGQQRIRRRLKLFLGAAPGVGKTYAMLTEAHAKRREGLDVLIGWVDTHGRRDTEALLNGLDVLARANVRRGTFLAEAFDIDAVIRRRPALVVIDELPHSNPPGSRHPKRWQDIEDILDVGIDVYSAMNIQHLESLNDMVGAMTGVAVKETIPDRFFDEVLWLGKPGESREHRCRVAETLAFAESLGAVTAMTSGSFAAEVSAYVREHNLSMIAIADMGLLATMRRRHLLRHVAPKITFVILSSNTEKPSIWDSLTSAFRTDADDVNYSGYVVSAVSNVLLAGLFSWLMPWIQPTNFAMCYLLVSFLVAIRYGMRPAAFAVVLSIVCFDLVAVAPLGSFAVSDLQYLFTFFVMLTVGIVSARLVAKSETIARESREREAQMSLLYETARSFAGFMDRESLYREAHEVMTTRLDIALEIWEPDSTNGFIRMNHALANADPALMQLAVDHHRPTGCATTTLSEAEYLYIPLVGSTGDVIAVAVCRLNSPDQWTDALSRRLIEALLTLLGQALERLFNQDEARKSLTNLENERLRHTLVRSLSHDLKTPLTTLALGAESVLEHLKNKDTDRAFDETIQLIKSSEGMSRMVNNMLDMAKLQSGSFKPNMTFFPADELVAGSIGLLKERLRDFHLDIRLQTDIPLLYGDQVLLERLLYNLIDNAVKYCPFGSRILVEVARRASTIMLAVHDNGPGLPAGDPQKLFDPFRRGQKESKIAGVGLGLAICRSIARAHNADLLALPSPMGGASFLLMLPLVEPPDMEDEDAILAKLDASSLL